MGESVDVSFEDGNVGPRWFVMIVMIVIIVIMFMGVGVIMVVVVFGVVV